MRHEDACDPSWMKALQRSLSGILVGENWFAHYLPILVMWAEVPRSCGLGHPNTWIFTVASIVMLLLQNLSIPTSLAELKAMLGFRRPVLDVEV